MATSGFGAFPEGDRDGAEFEARQWRLASTATAPPGHWIDHGHHALMRIAAFRAVGGYDESFSHNEDAELDYRLRAAGYRIWMTDKTLMVYYPRASVDGSVSQYLGYGRGRAKNILKHRAMPKIRQMIPLVVVPGGRRRVLLRSLNWRRCVPAALWAAVCLGYGVWMAVRPAQSLRSARRRLGHGHAFRLVGRLLAAASRPRRNRAGVACMSALQQAGSRDASTSASAPIRRPELDDTLRSLAALDDARRVRRCASSSPTMTSTPSAAGAGRRRWRRNCRCESAISHAPARNISIARNACLDASRRRFPRLHRRRRDGVAPHWLAELVATAEATGADAVLGPVQRRLSRRTRPTGCGAAISIRPCRSGCDGEIRTGYTCNVLLRLGIASLSRPPLQPGARPDRRRGHRIFRPDGAPGRRPHRLCAGRLGRRAGAAQARSSFRWLAKRRFRVGQTHGRLLGRNARRHRRCRRSASPPQRPPIASRAALRSSSARYARNRSVLRGIMHVGVVSGLLGVREIHHYGDATGGRARAMQPDVEFRHRRLQCRGDRSPARSTARWRSRASASR